MSSRPLIRLALLAWASATLLAALPARSANDDLLSQAVSAAHSGNIERSLELYDEFLVGHPEDVTALNNSAQQLSWLRRFDEALARYERVLALQPDNHFALLETAKVLSWSRRYDESIAVFGQLLALDPGDAEARIGLARVLSWSGRLADAREQYERVLEAQPGRGDALIGLAQTHAWSGDLQTARRLYGDAANALADPKDAEIGLAYIDLWEGASGRALATAEALDGRHAGDGDVAELLRAARRATAPWIGSSWDQLQDSDDQQMTTWRAETGFWALRHVATRLSYADYDMRSQQDRGTIRSAQARLDWVPARAQRLGFMLGVDRWSRPSQPSDSIVDWGVSYAFPVRGTWTGWVGASREPYRYSVQLIDNRIAIESFAAGTSGGLPRDWKLTTELAVWNTSDDNRRLSADLHAHRPWRLGAHSLESGIRLRWLDWQEETAGGYFDPANFFAVGVPLRASGPVAGSGAVDYGAAIELGVQSFTHAGSRTSLDPYYVATARLAGHLGARLDVEVFAEAGSYASEGPEDWRYWRAGARFTWRLGDRP